MDEKTQTANDDLILREGETSDVALTRTDDPDAESQAVSSDSQKIISHADGADQQKSASSQMHSPSSDSPKSSAGETSYDSPKSSAGETSNDSPKSSAGETSNDSPKSSAGETSYDSPKSIVGETSYDSPKSSAGKTSYDSPKSGAGETSYDSPKSGAGETSSDSPKSDVSKTSSDSLISGVENSSLQFSEISTTSAHQCFTAIGFAFVLFQIVFVTMFSENFWFGIDVRWLGIPVALVALMVAHFLLRWQESPAGCNLFSPIWKQRPPIVYSRWVRLNDPLFPPGIRFGNCVVSWSAIDKLESTFLGSLLIKSYALSGRPIKENLSRTEKAITEPSVVLKLPLGVAASESQNLVLQSAQQLQPNVVLNSRLTKRTQSKDVKGTEYVQLLGSLFLFLVLMDVGYSLFGYLETLKGLYLAQQNAIAGHVEQAQKDYDRAIGILEHPLPFSWVSNKVMTKEPIAPGLLQAQADALWYMGKREDALKIVGKAAAMSKKSFRINLKMARMLTAMHRETEAAEQLDKAKQSHKDSFLPQLYMVALRQGSPPEDIKPRAKKAFDQYVQELDDDLFADEPRWPPGGNQFLHDVWYSDDLRFIFDRMIGVKSQKSHDAIK